MDHSGPQRRLENVTRRCCVSCYCLKTKLDVPLHVKIVPMQPIYLKFKNVFIWLHLVLVETCRVLGLHCGMRDLFSGGVQDL